MVIRWFFMASPWALYALRITTAIRASLGVLTDRGPLKQTAARRRLCLIWRPHGEACYTPTPTAGVVLRLLGSRFRHAVRAR